MSAPTTPPALPSGLLEQYEPVRVVGAGGMGTVWLVRDRMLDRHVALKLLHPALSGPDDRERFLREARTAAKLVHPHIVPIFRAAEADDAVWFTMAFVDGESVGDRLRDRGRLTPDEVVRVLREAASALAYAHARGVVHRDVKPDNLLLDRESGRTLVTDFGIARDLGSAAHALTTDGMVLGTVAYMSPEQAAGEPLDGRSDVYALGVVGFLLLTGQLPFDGSPQAILVAHVTKPAPALQSLAPEVPAAIARVIDRCLQKAPADRYESAEQLAEALDEALESLRRGAAAPRVGGGLGDGLSEAEAMAVWQRAAQLQAEAAHRMERTMSLRRSDGAAPDGAVPTGRFRVADVEAAAVEAGISRQYVALALAERAGSDRPAPLVVGDTEDRRITALLGVTARGLNVARTIPAAPRAVLAVLRRVVTAAPYHLELDEIVGGHPLDGGILRFRVPTIGELAATIRSGSLPPLGYRLNVIDLRYLNVTLATRGTATQPATEVVVSGDLREGLRQNLRWSQRTQAGLATMFGGVGGGVAAVGFALGGLAAVPAAAGAALGLAVGRWGYRAAYQRGVRQSITELEQMLRVMHREATSDAVFGPGSAPPPPPPKAGGDDGFLLSISA
jgi:eukaryotic-like serine/threonine-protein kinase